MPQEGPTVEKVANGQYYDQRYYQTGLGNIPYERNSHWLSFFGSIADEVIRLLHPRTVFDAGCAWGFLVESFWDRGVEAYGADLSPYAISQVRRDMKPYCSVASIAEPIKGRFDLVTCLEVLEHMTEDEARSALRHMAEAAEQILFSSTPDDLTEPSHINVRPSIYWLKLFAEYNYFPDLAFDASFIAPHAFLVRQRLQPTTEDLLFVFSDILKYRTERVAFRQRHNRIEFLETQAVDLRGTLDETTQRLTTLTEMHGGVCRAVGALSEQRDEWIRTQSDLASARVELAATQKQLTRLQEQHSEMAQTLAFLSNEKEQWLTTQAELTRSLGRVVTMEHQTEELQKELESARSIIPMWEESQNQRAAMQASEAYWKGVAAERDLATQQLSGELRSLENQRARSEELLKEWIGQNQDLQKGLDSLAQQYEAARMELGAINGSPGWQLIVRYRSWLREYRWRRPRMFGVWESMVRRFMRRAHIKTVPRPDITPDISFAPSTAHDEIRFSIDPMPIAQDKHLRLSDYETWIREHEPDAVQLKLQRLMSAHLSYRPKISVILPVYRVPVAVLREAIESVQAQTYDHWELCIAIPPSENLEGYSLIEEMAARDARIRVQALKANEGISVNSEHALTLATGEYLALLDHDDTLAPFALYEVAQVLNQDPSTNFIYSDKDQLSEDGSRRLQPLFKPEWSPEIMLNANYLTHLCVIRIECVRQVGGWRKEADGAQDWDLFLRVIHRFEGVRHIPKILYHWRQISTSVAAGGLEVKPYAEGGQVRAVQDYCKSLGIESQVRTEGDLGLRISWSESSFNGNVSIIYVSRSPVHQTFARIRDLRKNTAFAGVEILAPTDEEEITTNDAVRWISVPKNASLAERMDAAVRKAVGQTLVFVDEGLTPSGSEWLREMIGPLQLPGVGAVGARLVDASTHTLRHCGIILSREGEVEHIYSGSPEHVYEAFGGAQWYRNWSAISGACFAIRRDLWDAVGGFKGTLLHPRLDVHLALKIRTRTNWRILYNPFARLLQVRDAALEVPQEAIGRAGKSKINGILGGADPYFNVNLDCHAGRVTFRRRDVDAAPAKGNDFAAESMVLTQIFDSSPAQLQHSRELNSRPGPNRLKTITWFIPDFANAFYGGIHTILRFADHFAQVHGVQNHFCVMGDASEAQICNQVSAAFPRLRASSRFFICDSDRLINDLPASDVAVCSLWTTAYDQLNFAKAKRTFYFIQDDEALFYPAGSTSSLVEATYGFGYYGICNTVSLLNIFRARGGRGESFTPQIDPAVFHGRDRKPIDSPQPYTLFCYARPHHPRNCFELVTAALRLLKARLGDELLVITAGAEWEPSAYGLGGIVHNMGVLSYAATGALYRMCDAGLVMMMTRHPSYLPLELMACGSLVITNKNPDTAWLLKHGENCLLADLTASSLAESVERGLKDIDLRRGIVTTARSNISTHHSDWGAEIEKIYRYMVGVC